MFKWLQKFQSAEKEVQTNTPLVKFVIDKNNYFNRNLALFAQLDNDAVSTLFLSISGLLEHFSKKVDNVFIFIKKNIHKNALE